MDQISSEREFAAGHIIAGKLRIVRRLGAGGMGSVYEVEHEITRHRRALKLLHAQMVQVPSIVERFLREASAAGRIGNPHIVETFDAGRLDSGEPYIVMELLHGRTLAELLDTSGPLELEAACEILMQACAAVAAAHAVGIVHRDLKPENLFLSGPDQSFVKILDFGISKFDAYATGVEALTIDGSPLGTPYYMAPEQVQGERTVDGRADVYALGVLLYECLTGQKPFVADTLPHLAVLIFQGNYVPATELRPGLPKAFDHVVGKAMARDRADRFATPQDLSLELSRLKCSLAPMTMGNEPRKDSPTPSRVGQLNRAAPALTPDVFSSPARFLPRPTTSHRSRRWLWAALGAVTVLLGVAGLIYRSPLPAARLHVDPASATLLAATPGVPATTAAALDLRAPTGSAATVDSAALPLLSAVASTRGASSIASPKPPNKVPNGTTAPSGTATPKPMNRANAYGLTEGNPFH